MPRPGYDPSEYGSADDEASILGRFEPAGQIVLREFLTSGAISEAHLVQLYRYTTRSPEARDAEALEDLANVAAGMSAVEFGEWVTEQIRLERDL